MKELTILIFTLILMSSCRSKEAAVEPSTMPAPQRKAGRIPRKDIGEFSPNTLIIMVDTEVGKEPLRKAIAEYGATVVYDYDIIPGMAIRIPEGADIYKAKAHFLQVKGVVSVERDRINKLTDPVRPKLEIR